MGRKAKTKSGKPGTEGVREEWDAAAEATNGAQARLPMLGEEEPIRVDIELPTPLGEDAVAMAARRAAEAEERIEKRAKEIAAHEAKIAKEKDAIKELRAEDEKDGEVRTKHLREVRTRSSWQTVPCVKYMLHNVNTVRIYRLNLDTGERGEHVRDDTMTAEEIAKGSATFATTRLDVADGDLEAIEPEPPVH